jgi:hypothetical protein
MLCLFSLAAVGDEVGDVEDAVGVGASVDALCGEGLNVGDASVLEGDGVIERVELVVVVVDCIGVGEVDGEDADGTGSCV